MLSVFFGIENTVCVLTEIVLKYCLLYCVMS